MAEPTMVHVIELPTADTPVAEAAEMYARAGLYPIRIHGIIGNRCTCGDASCRSPGKHPVGAGWERNLTNDIDRVRDVFRGHRGNIGIALAERFVLIDADGPRGITSFERITGEQALPETLRSVSGSGEGGHWIFRLARHHNPRAISDRAVAEKLDVKVRGQFVAAPSLHRSGKRYRWLSAVAPATLPDWLYECIRRPIAAAPTVVPPAGQRGDMFQRVRAYVAKIPGAVSGQRGHETTFKVANVIANNGLAMDEQWTLILEYNQRCDPPWSEAELRHKLESARAARNPHVLPERERPDLRVVPGGRDDHGSGGGAGGSGSGGGGGGHTDDSGWLANCLWEDTKRGPRLRRVAENVVVILEHSPVWRGGKLRFDEFSQRILLRNAPWSAGDNGPRQWQDVDTTRLQGWLLREHSLDVSTDAIERAVSLVAANASFHLVREWMDTIEWDQVPRIDRWLHTYLGAPLTAYSQAVGRWWLLSAVARTYQPGAKADHVLILEGTQGLGKSSALRALAGAEWFTDTPIDIGSKDAYMALRGHLIVELGELESLRRADAERAKAFFSSSVDSYRPPYGRAEIQVPRSCIFAGTVNHGQYLRDETGGRRYWPVACSRIDVPAIERDRAQLWAEAVSAYQDGAAWWPETQADRDLCVEEQAARFVEDAWGKIISEWLHANDRMEDSPVTVSDVMERALQLPKGQWTRAEQMRVVAVLTGLGFTLRKDRRFTTEQVRYYIRESR
jgi:predicted P-loop ATPase